MLSLKKYGPIINSDGDGSEILERIRKELSKSEIVEIDLSDIKSMATYCAKQIFGTLYLELGSQDFFNKVILNNADEDLRAIIKFSILDAKKGFGKSMDT